MRALAKSTISEPLLLCVLSFLVFSVVYTQQIFPVKRSLLQIYRNHTYLPITSLSTSIPSSSPQQRITPSRTVGNITTSDLEHAAQQLQSLSYFQSLLRHIAASTVEERLADLSFFWANKAQFVVSEGYAQAIQLTSKSQEAQLLSLKRSSIAQLLRDATVKMQRIHHFALRRSKILEDLVVTAYGSLKLVATSHDNLIKILSSREKQSLERQATALKLASYIFPKVVQELQASVEFARVANSVLLDME